MSKLQSKCTLEHFKKKSLFNERNTFLQVSSNFHQKKHRIFSHFFETVVETASYRYRRLLWEEKTFRWDVPIFIFALPEKMIPNWGRKSSAGFAKLDFKSRDERFGVFWFFREWTEISLQSKTLGKFWIKKSQLSRRRFSSHVENLAKNKTPGNDRDFMHLQNLLKMPFRKLEACLWKKSFFNCFNFFRFKGNLCFRKSVIHGRKKRFRGLITKYLCYIFWSLRLPGFFA